MVLINKTDKDVVLDWGGHFVVPANGEANIMGSAKTAMLKRHPDEIEEVIEEAIAEVEVVNDTIEPVESVEVSVEDVSDEEGCEEDEAAVEYKPIENRDYSHIGEKKKRGRPRKQ